MSGRVVLVGAGPGDPDLITVAGLKALRDADVIVTDRLVPGLLLDEARKDAKIIPVGKTPRGNSPHRNASTTFSSSTRQRERPWCGSKAGIRSSSAAATRN